jgi:hypothetical protein
MKNYSEQEAYDLGYEAGFEFHMGSGKCIENPYNA